jgi:CelD/BcsL family acetyltransferase involved in cellulose biosynthesis
VRELTELSGETAPSSTAITVEEVRSRCDFERLRSDWNGMVARVDDQVFYRHEFINNWLRHFAHAPWRILLLRNESGRLAGALPLLSSRSSICGVPVRTLHSASNSHSGRFDFLAEEPAPAARAVLQYLGSRTDWDVIVLSEMPASAACDALLAAAPEKGMRTGQWSAPGSPFLMLPANQELLTARLSSRFRGSLRRKRRNLGKEGVLRSQRSRDDFSMLEQGMQLEASGWKGRAGTAMRQDIATRAFYLELAERMSDEGNLVMWALWLDEHMVAFQYGLEYRGCYSLLKVAYDEEYYRFSPGQLLMEDVVKDAIDRGLKTFDFLGDDMEWKQAWRPELRCQQWLYLFADTAMGRLAHRAKFRLLPRIRQLRKHK